MIDTDKILNALHQLLFDKVSGENVFDILKIEHNASEIILRIK